MACWKTVTSGVFGELERNGRRVLRRQRIGRDRGPQAIVRAATRCPVFKGVADAEVEESHFVCGGPEIETPMRLSISYPPPWPSLFASRASRSGRLGSGQRHRRRFRKFVDLENEQILAWPIAIKPSFFRGERNVTGVSSGHLLSSDFRSPTVKIGTGSVIQSPLDPRPLRPAAKSRLHERI